MEKWKEKLHAKFTRKYGRLIKEQADAVSNDQLRIVLRKLILKAPRSVHALLSNDMFKKLHDFVMAVTVFLPDSVTTGTRCWYAANDKHEIVKCHNCGRGIVRDFKSNCAAKAFWCSSKCQGEDTYLARKISRRKFRHGKYTETCRDELPAERVITYRDSPIVYDDCMNNRLLDYYESHKKAFSYWIEQDKDLKAYLMDKSYPLDFTDLKVETRVKWVADKMQRLPVCAECGRQLDFADVKMSRKWPEFCSVECKKKCQSEFSAEWHASEIYGRMLDSKLTQPLFTLDEFKVVDRRSGEFAVKCLRCGGEFSLPFNLNFYNRNSRKSYFRCPNCFPIIGKRQKSKGELEIYNYVKNVLGVKNVRRGDRSTIYPFELDVHPMKDHFDVAVEYNGVFWHSLENGCKRDHVLDKVKMCEERGIKLIVVWEDEYIKDKEKQLESIRDIVLDPARIVHELTAGGTVERFEVERMKFNKCWEFPGYELIGETGVETVTRSLAEKSQHWTDPTAGKLIYRKIMS